MAASALLEPSGEDVVHSGEQAVSARRTAGLLVALEAFVCLGAWVGVVGFATGAFDSLVVQLPWQSWQLGAVALAACIAVPTTVGTVAMLRRRTWGTRAALLSAAVLAGWLLGQTAFVGFSAFQPAFLVVAAGIVVLAVRLDRYDRT
jgi:hypothetical protein